MIVANATGCSSIYGGNLPTTPWTRNAEGRGPAWSNSLFEDNAEFGLGMRLALDRQADHARALLAGWPGRRRRPGRASSWRAARRRRPRSPRSGRGSRALRAAAGRGRRPAAADAQHLLAWPTTWSSKSVWIIGGDGWAYDIGFGGLDHVLASGRNVNILVLDTEVYSNTGGQASKATPRGAVAKFAAARQGRPARRTWALIAMAYGNVYVAQIAMGANDAADGQGACSRPTAWPGPVADHRLQHLHRPRHRHVARR